MAGRGDVLGGKYCLVEKIGEGGMGTVWLARNEELGNEVAVKILHKTLVTDPQALARFRNEARAAARINHPGICTVMDMGEHDGAPFLVMERLQGESLADAIARQGTLEPRRAAQILCEVLDTLAAAHAEGILHRDLKPENVFLARKGEHTTVKILDFGVAKFIGDDAERVRLTRTGALVGTPAYMSPEQARGLEVDERSDVWAAGVLLYEMLSGKLPYEAPNFNAMLVAIATTPPRRIETVVPSIDPVLADIVSRALATDPRERYPSAKQMADDLRAWLDGALEKSPRTVAVSTPWSAAITRRMEPSPKSQTPHVLTLSDGTLAARRSPWIFRGVVGMVFAVAGMVVVWGALTGRRDVSGELRSTAASATTVQTARPSPDNELRLLGLPAGAQVRINGMTTQLPARIARGQTVVIEVTAPGFEPWARTVTPAGDIALTYDARPAVTVSSPVTDASVPANPSVSSRSSSGSGRRTFTVHRPRERTQTGLRRGERLRQPLRSGVEIDPDF